MPGRSSGPARSWSWHRLADPFANEIVARSGVGPSHLVLDLGAGDGAIAQRLARTGARVIAFELHPERSRTLRTRFADVSRVKIVRADVRDLRLPKQPFRVVASPPFEGVSAVLVRLTSRGSRLERADLIVPTSVARTWTRRLVTRPGVWLVTATRPLPRAAFTPRPRIDCCVIVIERRVR